MSIKRRVKVDKDNIYVPGNSVIVVAMLLTYVNSSAWEEKCIPLKSEAAERDEWKLGL